MPFLTILLPGIVAGGLLTYFAWASTHYLPDRFHPDSSADVTVMLGGLVFIFAFILGIALAPRRRRSGRPAPRPRRRRAASESSTGMHTRSPTQSTVGCKACSARMSRSWLTKSGRCWASTN